jgi:hypothetical protein
MTPPPKPRKRFTLADQVRVQPASVLKRLRQGRLLQGRGGQDGQIIYHGVGPHSQKTLYTLIFTDQNGVSTTGCFFDDELELTPPSPAEPSVENSLPARPFRAGPRSRPSALSERLRAALGLRRLVAST